MDNSYEPWIIREFMVEKERYNVLQYLVPTGIVQNDGG